jgi:hypothetical protein
MEGWHKYESLCSRKSEQEGGIQPISVEKNFQSQTSFLLTSTIFMAIISILMILQVCSIQTQSAVAQQQPQVNLTSAEKQSLLDGISFQMDNVTFSHHMVTVNGIQLHYVMGGQGDPVILLHGWPQTWYEWRHVMPSLAKNYTVIVPDLRGLGDSSKPVAGYDGNTTAEDICQLVSQLGFNKIFLVAHDIGAQTAY